MDRKCQICETRQGVEQPGGIVVCAVCEEELLYDAEQLVYQRTETIGQGVEALLSYGT